MMPSTAMISTVATTSGGQYQRGRSALKRRPERHRRPDEPAPDERVPKVGEPVAQDPIRFLAVDIGADVGLGLTLVQHETVVQDERGQRRRTRWHQPQEVARDRRQVGVKRLHVCRDDERLVMPRIRVAELPQDLEVSSVELQLQLQS